MSANENIGIRWMSDRPDSHKTNPAWLAYEFFPLTSSKEPAQLTVKTDISAFGCVCYEVDRDFIFFSNGWC